MVSFVQSVTHSIHKNENLVKKFKGRICLNIYIYIYRRANGIYMYIYRRADGRYIYIINTPKKLQFVAY